MQFGDWSSDVCSSDLGKQIAKPRTTMEQQHTITHNFLVSQSQNSLEAMKSYFVPTDRKSVV